MGWRTRDRFAAERLRLQSASLQSASLQSASLQSGASPLLRNSAGRRPLCRAEGPLCRREAPLRTPKAALRPLHKPTPPNEILEHDDVPAVHEHELEVAAPYRPAGPP